MSNRANVYVIIGSEDGPIGGTTNSRRAAKMAIDYVGYDGDEVVINRSEGNFEDDTFRQWTEEATVTNVARTVRERRICHLSSPTRSVTATVEHFAD